MKRQNTRFNEDSENLMHASVMVKYGTAIRTVGGTDEYTPLLDINGVPFAPAIPQYSISAIRVSISCPATSTAIGTVGLFINDGSAWSHKFISGVSTATSNNPALLVHNGIPTIHTVHDQSYPYNYIIEGYVGGNPTFNLFGLEGVSGEILRYFDYTADANIATSRGQYGTNSSTTNLPSGTNATGTLLVQAYGDVVTQFYIPFNHQTSSTGVWIRSSNGSPPHWNPWVNIGGGGARVVARCSFNGEASPISIYGSYGVSGVTDNGSGDYTVNFSGSHNGYTANWSVGDEFDEYFGNISNAYNSNSLRVRCLQVLDNPEKRDCAFGFLSIMV